MRLHAPPSVGQRAIGGAEAGGGDALRHRAEGESEVCIPLRREIPKRSNCARSAATPTLLRKVDRRHVQRAGERLAQRHLAVVVPAGVAGLVTSGKDAGRVVHKTGGQVAVALQAAA